MSEPDIGTIADGVPHPTVRRQVPDTQDRYDQVVVALREQLEASAVTHHRDEGGFHCRIERPLDASVSVDVGADTSTVATAWPPQSEAPIVESSPAEGTLAVAAAYGFVCTGLRISGTTQPAIAATQGSPTPSERAQTPSLATPRPTLVVELAFHDVTGDGFRAQCRHDGRIRRR